MKGVLETRELHSPALESNPLGDPSRRALRVYLPPGYGEGQQRYPTVYFLHAFTHSGASWTNVSAFGLSLLDRLDAMIEAGTISPLLGVVPAGWRVAGGRPRVNRDAIRRL